MSSETDRIVTLPPEQARRIDDLMASGAYASVSEVIGAGLEALQDRNADIERWLREEVGPAYDAVQADPDSAVSASDVEAALNAAHAARLRQG